MPKVYDICVKSREYTARNGDNKVSWVKVGEVWKAKDSDRLYARIYRHINFAAFPCEESSDNVLCSLFEPKNKDDSNRNSYADDPPAGMPQARKDWSAADDSEPPLDIPF